MHYLPPNPLSPSCPWRAARIEPARSLLFIKPGGIIQERKILDPIDQVMNVSDYNFVSNAKEASWP
jgi:hypothetical protein